MRLVHTPFKLIKALIKNCVNFSPEIIDELINVNYDLNIYNHNGTTPLIDTIGASKRDLSTFKKLIAYGVDINLPDKRNYYGSPFHLACSENSLEMVEILIKCGVDINAKYRTETELMICAREQKIELLDLLINSGADLDIQNSYGETALHIASSQRQCLPVIERLLEAGADLHIKNNYRKDWYENTYKYVQKFIVKNYPDFLEERELRRDAEKYNL